VYTPEAALQELAADYEAYRIVATLSFSVRLKRAQLAGLEHTLSECVRAVAASRDAGRDELATRWREIEEFVRAERDGMRMWILLRENKFHAAWEALISAQSSAYWAARWLPTFEPGQQLEEQLEAIERVVFPRQKFFSPAMIINEADVECSICHARGGECDHIAGDIYAGEVANRIIHNITGVREVSLVDKPANKRARASYYGDMDLLTGETRTSTSEIVAKRKKKSRRRVRP
jgi:hypothetical protein